MSRMTPQDLPLPPSKGRISDRLAKALGLGTAPELRRALYLKLESLCEGYQGSECLDVIDAVVSDAQDKDDPGKYFAYVVCRRLQEKGLMVDRQKADW